MRRLSLVERVGRVVLAPSRRSLNQVSNGGHVLRPPKTGKTDWGKFVCLFKENHHDDTALRGGSAMHVPARAMCRRPENKACKQASSRDPKACALSGAARGKRTTLWPSHPQRSALACPFSRAILAEDVGRLAIKVAHSLRLQPVTLLPRRDASARNA